MKKWRCYACLFDNPADRKRCACCRRAKQVAPVPRCICHQGSVCGPACDRGRCHTGCPNDETKR